MTNWNLSGDPIARGLAPGECPYGYPADCGCPVCWPDGFPDLEDDGLGQSAPSGGQLYGLASSAKIVGSGLDDDLPF